MERLFKTLSIISILILTCGIDTASFAQSEKVPYAVLKDSTMTFYYGKYKPAGAYDVEKIIITKVELFDGEYGEVWEKEWKSVTDQIKTVVFDKSFKNCRPTTCAYWFCDCRQLSKIVDMEKYLNTSRCSDMSYMFCVCSGLTSLDVSNFNTKNVTKMWFMFPGCSALTSLDVSNFNTEKVTNMKTMFTACSNLVSLDVSNFNTENVTDMSDMLNDCESLTTLDISNFNTSNVKVMESMFADCYSLKTIYVGNGWKTSEVTNSEYMFAGCTSLVGGKGTKCDGAEREDDVSFARIDGGESAPGYLTKKE